MSTSKKNQRSKDVISYADFDDFKDFLLDSSYEVNFFPTCHYGASLEMVDHFGYEVCEQIMTECVTDVEYRNDNEAEHDISSREVIFLTAEKDNIIRVYWIDRDCDDYEDIITSDLIPFIIDYRTTFIINKKESSDSQQENRSDKKQVNEEIQLKPFGFTSVKELLDK